MISNYMYLFITSIICIWIVLERKNSGQSTGMPGAFLITFFIYVFSVLMVENKSPMLIPETAGYLIAFNALRLFLTSRLRRKKQRQVFAVYTTALLAYPVPMISFLYGSLIGIAAAVFSAIVLLAGIFAIVSKKEYKKENIFYADDEEEEEEQLPKKKQGRKLFFAKDWICMLIITAIYAAVSMIRLGGSTIPETGLTLTPDNNEIILCLDEPTDIREIQLYVGYTGNRNYAFSCAYADDEAWTVFEEEKKISFPYYWNTVSFGDTTELFGIVYRDQNPEAVILEMALIDFNGDLVLPANAADYPALFDEQEKFDRTHSYYNGIMFDEVYHARTAYEFIHEKPIYENTHPPLGKLLIGIGIRLFGMNPFGWRIVCWLFGVLTIPMMYLMCRLMFDKTKPAAAGALLFSTGFMHLTLSRIATLDIIVAFFILGSFTMMYGAMKFRSVAWMLLTGIFMAFAISCKWTGVYACVGIAIIFFIGFFREFSSLDVLMEEKARVLKLALLCTALFIILPLTVYVLSYIPYAKIEGKTVLACCLDNAKLMLSYHKGVTASHPSQSVWYEWLLDLKPVADATSYMDDGSISIVKTFGNPLIFWLGLAALLYNSYSAAVKKDRNGLFLVIAYLAMLMPWLMIHRTVFIYQYMGCSMILVPLIMNMLKASTVKNKAIVIVCLISVILFIGYFPVLTGCSVSQEYISALPKLKSWGF